MRTRIPAGVFVPLGIVPVAGSLNVAPHEDVVPVLDGLEFTRDTLGRRFYPARLWGQRVWVMRVRKSYADPLWDAVGGNVLEVIADVHLRTKFDLVNRDEVELAFGEE